jgi:hypothetical protein
MILLCTKNPVPHSWFIFHYTFLNYHTDIKQTPWSLVRERIIPTERPSLVDKFSANFVDRGVPRGQRGGSLTVVNLSFLERSRYFSFK